MEVLVVVVGITASVIALIGQIPDPRKVKRELARARVQSIDSLADGKPAAVRGTIATTEPGATTVDPLLRRACVYWLIVFDEVGVAGDYQELGRTSSGVPFLLRSDHGTARVVPDKPRLAIHAHVISRPITERGPLTMLASAVCKRHNYNTSWLRATIYALEPGAFVTISGWCTREPDPEASEDVTGYREQLPTRPVISGTRRKKLLIG